MVRLYFKHLYPSMKIWQEKPFSPWEFKEHVLLSVLPFFESELLKENFSLKKELDCEIFMDSGAFTAASMGFQMDPYEVAEIQAILKADKVVPLDLVIFEYDTKESIQEKITATIKNTEILLDLKAKESTLVAPLQGFSKRELQNMFENYRELGINNFALGGIVFQKDHQKVLERIKLVREITKGYSLHVFGKFLHPLLLKEIIELDIDSVDGFGYILSSIKGQYILKNDYVPIMEVEEQYLELCTCPSCTEFSLEDFQRGDKEAQLLLLKHNIISLNNLAKVYQKERRKRDGN